MSTILIKLVSVVALLASAFIMSYEIADEICHQIVIFGI